MVAEPWRYKPTVLAVLLILSINGLSCGSTDLCHLIAMAGNAAAPASVPTINIGDDDDEPEGGDQMSGLMRSMVPKPSKLPMGCDSFPDWKFDVENYFACAHVRSLCILMT